MYLACILTVLLVLVLLFIRIYSIYIFIVYILDMAMLMHFNSLLHLLEVILCVDSVDALLLKMSLAVL